MSERFYTDEPLSPGECTLAGPEARHIATVRRFGPGDRVTLFNGDGREYPAEIVAADRKRVHLTILNPIAANRELPFPLVIASALPKGDRADFLIEKLTELGVTRFVPLITARSVVVPKASAAEKLSRAVIEASKQCGRNRLMVVEEPWTWDEFVGRGDLTAHRFVLHPPEGAAARLPDRPPTEGIAFAVGPEGGLTEEEVAQAEAAGWQKQRLGPRVLRVETAAVAAAAWASLASVEA